MFKKIYTYYAAFVVLFSFLLIYPFFFLFLQSKKGYTLAHECNRVWGRVVYFLCGLPLKVEWRFKPKKGEVYIYCANHTSYSDIPTMYLITKGDLIFIGKSSLGKVPLFGYMYKRLHILVDRKSVHSKMETIERAKLAIDSKQSLAFFPEGTIPKAGNRPAMIPFKDGPFKIAIEKKIKIIPVTLINNWKILQDGLPISANRMECKVVVHEPIDTSHLESKDFQMIKDQTFLIITNELKKYHHFES